MVECLRFVLIIVFTESIVSVRLGLGIWNFFDVLLMNFVHPSQNDLIRNKWVYWCLSIRCEKARHLDDVLLSLLFHMVHMTRKCAQSESCCLRLWLWLRWRSQPKAMLIHTQRLKVVWDCSEWRFFVQPQLHFVIIFFRNIKLWSIFHYALTLFR